MKNEASQTGSAHVVLIVLLILVILGGLGYVAYEEFASQKQKTSSQPSSSASTTQKTPTAATRELTFGSWQVAITIPSASNLYIEPYRYASDTDSSNLYYVGDTDFDRACTEDPDTSIAGISRLKADDQVDSYYSADKLTNREYFTQNPYGSVVLGNYVYVYAKPNGSFNCFTSANGKVAADAFSSAGATFRKALPGMHKTAY